MQKPSIGKRIRRIARKHFGPKQESLKPAFKDGLVFHSHVRVGKREPDGKPKAIVVTKFRTMKRGAHADFEQRGRNAEHHKTWLGRMLRPRHLDELPQAISVLRGDLKPIGLRPLPKNLYRKLTPELKKIYDEIGPGFIGLQYCCKSKKPSREEFIEVVREFYEMWKKSPKHAYWVFRKRFLKNYKQEMLIEEFIGQ